ncbi:hypothetical protein D9758_016602 [Tetrapyrgos nigripes]|uniref:HAT C-terminal dimerisation domain-containing protein n=1 Tax=Tetrapyrgos nigripes TaxID=182062 RepID=A0A8H5CGI3_9AGAR|nr:hypothetical protein D9758_016602 [Tetrapyrgos nigripes]
MILNTELDPAIRTAVSLARVTLNKYYAKTSDVYRIAMVLHPRHKLNYFKSELKYSAASLRSLKLIVRGEFDQGYKKELVDDKTSDEMDVDEVEETVKNRFDNLPSLAPPIAQTLRDELDKYLDSDPEAVEDVLVWWYGKKKTFPCLYRMALDYLTISATSTDVEWHFSRGRLLPPYVRNRLKAQTMWSLMCLGQWSPLGMIHDDDIKAVVLLDKIPLEEGDEDGDIEMPEGWDRIDSDIEDGI